MTVERVGGLALLGGVLGLWAMILGPSGPYSTPIHFVVDSLPVPATPAELPPAPSPAPGAARARLAFVGDIMQHHGQAGDDFRASYAEVAPVLRRYDLAIGNLEFPVDPSAPVGPEPGTARFNGSPAHLDALADAGFDLLGTANNHADDRGPGGLGRTVEEIERRGLRPLGSAATLAQLEAGPLVVTVNGIPIAVDAYTIPLNVPTDSAGEPDWPPPDLPVFVLDFSQWRDEYRAQGVALFRERVARARAAGARFLVAFVHWGREWYLRPTADQRAAGHDLIDAGFDLVVGAHGHVLNAPEIYRGKLIAYSLGNFISDFKQVELRTGAILDVDLVDGASGPVIAGFGFRPVLVRRRGHVVRPIREAGAGEDAAAWRFARKLLGPATLSE